MVRISDLLIVVLYLAYVKTRPGVSVVDASVVVVVSVVISSVVVISVVETVVVSICKCVHKLKVL